VKAGEESANSMKPSYQEAPCQVYIFLVFNPIFYVFRGKKTQKNQKKIFLI
jgi:hypothetical protein